MSADRKTRTGWSTRAKVGTGVAAGVAALAIAGGVVVGLHPYVADAAAPEPTRPPAGAEVVDEVTQAPASDLVTMPELTGMTSLAAQSALLDDAGLRHVDFVSPAGLSQMPSEQTRVIAQSVAAGERVSKDAAITITVVARDSAMPDFVGMSTDEAKAALDSIGFEPEWAEWRTADGTVVTDLAALAGRTVIDQTPSTGTAVYPGDTIVITVR